MSKILMTVSAIAGALFVLATFVSLLVGQESRGTAASPAHSNAQAAVPTTKPLK